MSFSVYIDDKENLINSPNQIAPRTPTKLRTDVSPKKKLFFSPSNTGLSPLLPNKRRALSPRISNSNKSPIARALSPTKVYRSTTPVKLHRSLELNSPIKSAEVLSDDTPVVDSQSESISEYGYHSLYDKYGFLISDERCTEPQTSPTEHDEAFWREMLSNWDTYWRAAVPGPALQNNTFFGALSNSPIPDHLRLTVWQKILNTTHVQQSVAQRLNKDVSEVYTYLVDLPENEWSNQIRLDLHRTFATHRLFLDGIGQEKMYRVLKAYSELNTSLGYCQGLSFIVAGLMVALTLDEETLFYVLVALLDHLSLNKYFEPGMQALVDDTRKLSRIFEVTNPELAQSIAEQGVDMIMFTSRWYLTLFTDLPEWSQVLRLWDVIVYLGVPAVNGIALALLQLSQGELVSRDSIELTVPFLLNLQSNNLKFDKIVALLTSYDLIALEARALTRATPAQPPRKRKASEMSKDTPRPRGRAASTPSRDTPRPLNKSSGGLFDRLELFWDRLTTPNKRRKLTSSEGSREYARLDSTPARACNELSATDTPAREHVPVDHAFVHEERQALLSFTTPQKRRDEQLMRSARKGSASKTRDAVQAEQDSPARPALEMKDFARL